MALFTDSNLITIDDLTQFENGIQQVSLSHNIDIPTKIRISWSGIGDKLSLWMVEAGVAYSQPMTSDSLQSWGVFSFGIGNVVLTPAIYRWLCFDSLARVYSEAYNFQLNTRFQGKFTEYQKEAQDVSGLVYKSGLDLVSEPLPRPDSPTLVIGPGSLSMPAVFTQISWVNSRGQESAPSSIGGSVLNGFASLTVQLPATSALPKTAVGWNLYAGSTQDSLSLQNSAPILPSAQWLVPANGLTRGSVTAGQGQTANLRIPLYGRIQRG